MNPRQALHASLSIWPPAPPETAKHGIGKIWKSMEFEEALRRAMRFSRAGDWSRVRANLTRAALIFIANFEAECEPMSQCTVVEAPSDALADELFSRAKLGEADIEGVVRDLTRRLRSIKQEKTEGAHVSS